MLIEETKWMKTILPKHYKCEPRENGVHCKSKIGIDDCDSEHFHYIFEAIKQKFGVRFMEVCHQTCTNHKEFTVYIKPEKNE